MDSTVSSNGDEVASQQQQQQQQQEEQNPDQDNETPPIPDDDWTITTGVSSTASEEEAQEEMQRRRRRKERERQRERWSRLSRSDGFVTCTVLFLLVGVGIPVAWFGNITGRDQPNDYLEPVSSELVEGDTPLLAIAGDSGHTCAIRREDGSVFCWSKQIGVPPTLPPAFQVAVGDGFSCALHENTWNENIFSDFELGGNQTVPQDVGIVSCWGGDFQADVLQPPSNLGDVVELVASGESACAIQANNKTGICWGFFEFGKDILQVPHRLEKIYLPKETSLKKLCAVMEDDQRLQCWSITAGSELSIETLFVPNTLGTITNMAMMNAFACAIPEQTGRIVCWFYDGTEGPIISADLSSMDLIGLYPGPEDSFCVIDTDNNPSCYNKAGMVLEIPPEVGKLTFITAGENHFCGLQVPNNNGVCWGYYARPGTLSPLTELPMVGKEIVAGDHRTCLARMDFGVACWGFFGFQLRVEPSSVVMGGVVTCVIDAADDLAKCVIGDQTFILVDAVKHISINQNDLICTIAKDDDTVRCYLVGCTESMRFGTQQWRCFGATNFEGNPATQLTGTSLDSLYLSESHFCGISSTSDRRLQCWQNLSTQKIDGNLSDEPENYPLENIPNDLGPVADVALGTFFTCAVEVEGSIRCWGDPDEYGNDYILENVPNEKDYVAIAATKYEVCAITADDRSVDCWGRPFISARYVPEGLKGVVQLSGGTDHFCAMTTTNESVCWGSNNDGELALQYVGRS